MKKGYSQEVGAKTAGLASYIFLSKAVSLLLSCIALITVARILGPSVYGVYAIAIAVAGMFGVAGDLGISTAFTKFIAEYVSTGKMDRTSDLMSNGLALLLVVGIAITSIAFLSSGMVAQYVLHSLDYVLVLQLASLTILFSMLNGAFYGALIGFGRGKHVALMLTTQIVAQSATSIALAMLGFGAIAPIAGLVIGYFIGAAVCAYVIFVPFGIKLNMPSVARMHNLLRFSLPIAAATLMAGVVNNLAFIILGLFATTVIVGDFGIATKIGSFINTLTESIAASLLPAFAATVAARRKDNSLGRFYNYSVRISLAIAAPLMLSIALLSTPFTITIFSGKYVLAPMYVAIVSIGILIGIASAYTSMLLISGNKVKELLKNNFVLVVVQLVALCVLVPNFKGTGAVVLLYVITPVTSVFLFTRESRKVLGIKLNASGFGRILLAGMISTAFILPLMYLLKENYIALLVASMIVQLLVYPPVLALVRGIQKRDLEVMRSITSNIPIMGAAVAVVVRYSSAFAKD